MRKLKGWKLFLYAMGALGPNMLGTLIIGYYNDAMLASTLVGENPAPHMALASGALVMGALSAVLFALAKVIDAVIDVPLAYLSDRLHCKFGRRRMGILLGFVPMCVSFVLLWNPAVMGGATPPTAGFTWLQTVLLVVFYVSYTLTTVSYYGAYASITENERDLQRLTHFKAFFDTIQYCVCYALFPSLLVTLLGGKEVGAIGKAVTMMAPLMLTMVIPLFLIKGENDEPAEPVDQRVPFLESLRISFASKSFRAWLLTQFMLHTGLMLFLTGIGTTIPHQLLGMEGWQITVMNSAAFAPVPLMLLIFNAIKKRRGQRFALQTALLVFGVAMITFAFGWNKLWGEGMTSFLIGITASTIGSYGVGVFFSVGYYYPAHIAKQEIATTKRDHSAMYFAVQGLVTQVASAVGANLIYNNLVNQDVNINLFGKTEGQFFLVPVLAGVMMLVACLCAFRLDKQMSEG